MTAEQIDTDQMSLRELRKMLDDAALSGAPPEATFSLSRLTNRGSLLASWSLPSGSQTGVQLFRVCPCGHADCPDLEEKH